VIVTIPVTAEERRTGAFAPAKADAAADALREDGLVILADAVDPAHVAALRERLARDLPRVLARRDAPFNFNAGNVQQSPPRDRELLFRDVLVNEQAIAVTSRTIPDPTSTFYSGNTALPSTQRQPVHADGGHLWADHLAPPCTIILNLPLVDMSAANGATELWPGTHRLLGVGRGADLTVPTTLLERRRMIRPPVQPHVAAGSLLLRDHRLWHAGMPNRTATPRPMLAMIHSAGWLHVHEPAVFRSETRDFFAHPLLRTRFSFQDAVDHIALDRAYGFSPTAPGAGGSAG
jgi:ectoine hydroxylase-related dioxygenase (phytanoyl-CoA dioxygenase family)